MLSNNADEYGGQTIPEKIAKQLHGENTVIVKLTPTSVAPERLLVLDVFSMDDHQLWTRLCTFLGRPCPPVGTPFPHQRYGDDVVEDLRAGRIARTEDDAQQK